MGGLLWIGDLHSFQNLLLQIRQTDSLLLPPLQTQVSYSNDVQIYSFEHIELAHSDSPNEIKKKNGILIVEFANQKRKQGEQKIPAAIDAAVARLRPMLMTTLATTLGALPIAMAIGSAGKSRVPLGIVIVGGLLFSLILTLYVVPALYSFLSRKKKVHEEEV